MAVTDWGDGFRATLESTTSSAYKIMGGRYAFTVGATFPGSVTLQMQLPDGTTYIDVAPALTANGSVLVDLPPGMYRVAIATATAVQYSLSNVPYRSA